MVPLVTLSMRRVPKASFAVKAPGLSSSATCLMPSTVVIVFWGRSCGLYLVVVALRKAPKRALDVSMRLLAQ